MTKSEHTRITLWNAIEAAEMLGGMVIFDAPKAAAVTAKMDRPDFDRFIFSSDGTDLYRATRKEP